MKSAEPSFRLPPPAKFPAAARGPMDKISPDVGKQIEPPRNVPSAQSGAVQSCAFAGDKEAAAVTVGSGADAQFCAFAGDEGEAPVRPKPLSVPEDSPFVICAAAVSAVRICPKCWQISSRRLFDARLGAVEKETSRHKGMAGRGGVRSRAARQG